MKISLLKTQTTESLRATTVAFLGTEYRSATSPKMSPASFLFTLTFTSSYFCSTSKSPDFTTYSSEAATPSSPSRIKISPASISLSYMFEHTVACLSGGSWAKMSSLLSASSKKGKSFSRAELTRSGKEGFRERCPPVMARARETIPSLPMADSSPLLDRHTPIVNRL